MKRERLELLVELLGEFHEFYFGSGDMRDKIAEVRSEACDELDDMPEPKPRELKLQKRRR